MIFEGLQSKCISSKFFVNFLAILSSRRNSGIRTQRQFSLDWSVIQNANVWVVGRFIVVGATKALVIGLAGFQTSFSVSQFQCFSYKNQTIQEFSISGSGSLTSGSNVVGSSKCTDSTSSSSFIPSEKLNKNGIQNTRTRNWDD